MWKYLAESVQQMYKVRVNQRREIQRQNRSKRNSIRIPRVKNTRSIDLIADNMQLVSTAELDYFRQSLGWVAAS